ncbi:head decoration protein [Paraburkholderia phenoliruptrix]|uniref:head decoration protein n=1 Tax=Paraburkholderia phenoliruptrix TaxID=252970 RepID=UPI003D990FD9
MTLNVNSIGDNPQQPGIYAETYIPDQLIAGNLKIVSQPIVLGAGKLPRGSVLGMISSSSVEVAAGTNTGNGTVGATSTGAGVKLGAYALKATGANTFTVTDPEGNTLPNATVGTAYSNGGLNFTITAGGTAFVANDSFALTVPDSAGTYILSVKTASDGSQTPVAILADAADATAGPVTTGAYLMAEVNGNALNYDASWNLTTLTAALRPYSIFVKSSVSAADPS